MKPDDLSRTIDLLAQRFGQTGANLWAAYWHATWFFALTCMVIFSGFGVVCARLSLWIEIEDDDFKWVKWACLIVSVAIVAASIAANLTDIVLPQGAALHSLVGR